MPVEPQAPPRDPGRIILLNGASSSGKSTLARRLQKTLETPFLYVASDMFVDGGMLAERREAAGEFAWWSTMRPRFFDGFHRCLPALASAGNDLVVEHILEFPGWRRQVADLLVGFDVFLVGVHCAVDELDRRERSRGDRRIGEGRAHVEENAIHTFGPYDTEVDTTSGVTDDVVQRVIAAWRTRSDRSALHVGNG